MEKVWKDIPGYEGIYQVNKHGAIKALPRKRIGYSYMANRTTERQYKERILKPSIMHWYLCCSLIKDGKYKTIPCHRAVALAFIPNPENKPNVNHIDFNPLNNNVENLEWCTQYENIHHTMNFNRDYAPRGSESPHSIIKDHRINDVFRLKKEGHTQAEIAALFGVTQSAISLILNRKRYKHIEATY